MADALVSLGYQFYSVIGPVGTNIAKSPSAAYQSIFQS
jgi:hypothetical protein